MPHFMYDTDIYSLGDAEMAKHIERALSYVKAIIFHINLIKESDDPKMIQASFYAIVEMEISAKPNIKERILSGQGDFSAINEKLIALNIH